VTWFGGLGNHVKKDYPHRIIEHVRGIVDALIHDVSVNEKFAYKSCHICGTLFRDLHRLYEDLEFFPEDKRNLLNTAYCWYLGYKPPPDIRSALIAYANRGDMDE
jgi:hypothetical protein